MIGSSRSIEAYRADGAAGLDAFKKKNGDAFLLVDEFTIVQPMEGTEAKTDPRPDGRSSKGPDVLVFEVKRRASSRFDFVSLGRNDGNDICMPHASISRFHAYFRSVDEGKPTLTDAKSANGTWIDGQPIPRQGEGEPRVLKVGDRIRFGTVTCVFTNAQGVLDELKRTR